MQQKITSTTTKGLILGLIMIAFSAAISFMAPDGSVQWIGYLVFFLGIIFSIMQFGKQMEYNSTFGNYFAHGFKVAAVVTILLILFLIIFMAIFPEFKEKALEAAKNAIDKRQNISENEKTRALEMTRKLFTVFMIGGALIAYLLCGVIASLIGAAVTKKDSRPFEDINQIGQ